jgi:plastocyanin
MKGRETAFAVALATAVVGAMYVAPAVGGNDATSAKTKSVSVRDDFFRPKRVTVGSGDRVRWAWRDEGTHNVRFRKVPRGASRRPGSRLKDSGTFARTFRKRGGYSYVCTIHEDLGMTGSVKVE